MRMVHWGDMPEMRDSRQPETEVSEGDIQQKESSPFQMSNHLHHSKSKGV